MAIMKRITLFLSILLSLSVFSQDNRPFALLQKGAVAEYSVKIGKKPNPAFPFMTKEITEVERLDDGTTRVVTKSIMQNKKKGLLKLPKMVKKAVSEDGQLSTIIIKNDTCIIDATVESAAENVNTDGFLLKIPSTMNVGDTLECGTLSMTFKLWGRDVKYKTSYSNFRVVAEKEITTAAGTFNCYVVRGRIKTSIKGGYTSLLGASGEYWVDDECWYARGIGVVRQITKVTNKRNVKPLCYELISITVPDE